MISRVFNQFRQYALGHGLRVIRREAKPPDRAENLIRNVCRLRGWAAKVYPSVRNDSPPPLGRLLRHVMPVSGDNGRLGSPWLRPVVLVPIEVYGLFIREGTSAQRRLKARLLHEQAAVYPLPLVAGDFHLERFLTAFDQCVVIIEEALLGR